MGPGNENFIDMCKSSVEGSDRVFHFTSDLDRVGHKDTFFNQWDESDKQTNGKSRNYYLEFLKENYPNDWALILDEDEVCEDLNKIKEFIQTAKPSLYSPKMRHFIGSLGWEDATTKNHWVPNRLFKISEADSYQIDSHPVLQPNKGVKEAVADCTTIWHLGHLPVNYMKYISKRYKEHSSNSTIHNQEFLTQWKNAHLFGTYPKSKINPTEIPKIILENFGLDFDELYFKDRGLEVKHFIDAVHWRDFFKCSTVYEFGCGRGPRVYAMNQVGIDAYGLDISKYAFENGLNTNIQLGDILEKDVGVCDLVIAYDLLEHINYKDLDKAIEKLIKTSKKNILISIPYKGTPNATADPTHIIIEDRTWWVKQFIDKGLKEVEVPEHFLYKAQLLIFEK